LLQPSGQRPSPWRVLGAAAGRDAGLVDHLTGLINVVYAAAELGLWRRGATRTPARELAELIRTGQIAVATREGNILGSVRIHDVADDASEFGMLVADPNHRGSRVGRALVDFAERRSRERGLRAIQLDLLVPRAWFHPNKEFLKSRYRRRGDRIIRTASTDAAYPHLAPPLATLWDLEVYEKPLQVPGRPP